MNSAIEIIRDFPRGSFRAALFDFDGTLSLLRRDWQQVMVSMMVAELRCCPAAECEARLCEIVEGYVTRLTGRQTIYQMMQLVDEVRQRGGEPCDPLEYKRRYHELLWEVVRPRIRAVRTGELPQEDFIVPHARALLEALRECGLELYLSSGTDLPFVRDELAVLGLNDFFEPRVFGALDDYQKFSKAITIERILSRLRIEGRQLIGFGDGYVEAEEVVKVGGLAIGVASNESSRRGVNSWKRTRLIHAGAQLIIGDYLHFRELLQTIGLRADE